MLDDETIQKLIDEIDRVPSDKEPRSRIFQAGPACYVIVEANRAGLILLARYFLAAATAPAVSASEDVGGKIIEVFDKPLKQIGLSEQRVEIRWIKRVTDERLSDESVARAGRLEQRVVLWSKLVCGLIVFFILFLLVSGIMLWRAVLFGDIR